jgi:hypothetical protein
MFPWPDSLEGSVEEQVQVLELLAQFQPGLLHNLPWIQGSKEL